MKKICIFILAAIAAVAPLAAEIPYSYYESLNGLTEANLKTAISKLVYNHKVLDYNSLPEYFKTTDSYVKNGKTYWWDMYSNIPVETVGKFGTYMNREHSFPKSWWGGLTTTPAYSDLFHLYPAEAAANQAKLNYPLGEVSSSTFDNGMVQVGYPVTGQGGKAGRVFEPSDEYKGDFARTYFYVVTCYQDLRWDTKYMFMLQQNTYPTLNSWAVALLLKWARQDPVSQKEIDRNEAVYRFQNNRNPFIDFPDLYEYIWGNKIGKPFDIGAEIVAGEPELITPVQDTSLDFNQIALGKSETSRLAFIGRNLSGNLSLTISGVDRAMFSLESKTLSTTLVNAEGGTSIPITYTPTAIGNHSANLVVYDGGMSGSRIIRLIGQCLEPPTLTAPTATAATDITSDSYVANWTVPDDEVVDYFIVSRTTYVNGNASTIDLLAEENSLLIEDFDASTSESYNVRSVRLGCESPRSNEIFVEHAGIGSVTTDRPVGWAPIEGGVRIVCGQTTLYDLSVYDIAGRLILVIPTVNNNDIIPLPVGAYILRPSDSSSTVIRVLVTN